MMGIARFNIYHVLCSSSTNNSRLLRHLLENLPADVNETLLTQQTRNSLQTVGFLRMGKLCINSIYLASAHCCRKGCSQGSRNDSCTFKRRDDDSRFGWVSPATCRGPQMPLRYHQNVSQRIAVNATHGERYWRYTF
jgi:hypothetical protein